MVRRSASIPRATAPGWRARTARPLAPPARPGPRRAPGGAARGRRPEPAGPPRTGPDPRRSGRPREAPSISDSSAPPPARSASFWPDRRSRPEDDRSGRQRRDAPAAAVEVRAALAVFYHARRRRAPPGRNRPGSGPQSENMLGHRPNGPAMSITLIPVAQARERVLATVRPLGSELVEHRRRPGAGAGAGRASRRRRPSVPLLGHGRVCDPRRVPRTPSPARRRIQSGHPGSDELVADDEAVRVSTGAAVPPGATAVIPQEEVTVDGDVDRDAWPTLRPASTSASAGEDMRAGSLQLTAGIRLAADRPRRRRHRRRRATVGPTRPRVERRSAPAMSSAPPASRWGRARSTTPMLRCWSA